MLPIGLQMEPRILNIDCLSYEAHSRQRTFSARFASVGRLLMASRLGYRVAVVPAGKRAWPLHHHYANEEMFFILDGAGTLRFGRHRVPVRKGDFIACPAGGPETAHQLVNDTEVELSYLCVSTMDEPDALGYPDSGKVAVFAGAAPGGDRQARTLSFVGRRSDAKDYWDGEE